MYTVDHELAFHGRQFSSRLRLLRFVSSVHDQQEHKQRFFEGNESTIDITVMSV